jgi:hypothetical protein
MKRVILPLLVVLLLASCQSDWEHWITDDLLGIDRDEPDWMVTLPGSTPTSNPFAIERVALQDEAPAGQLAVRLALKWGDGWCSKTNPLGVQIPDELRLDPDGPAGEMEEQTISLDEVGTAGCAEVTVWYPAAGEYLATARIRGLAGWGSAQLTVTVL